MHIIIVITYTLWHFIVDPCYIMVIYYNYVLIFITKTLIIGKQQLQDDKQNLVHYHGDGVDGDIDHVET